ncbi:MAG: PhnA protein [Bacteroidetes bacterium]|nr:MAG: PhnA protein [Bacteroidota bacterium]PTM14732.1 MAG: PhnA protein [Bacteroidota bacterium]
MRIESELNTRSGGACELCGATNGLLAYTVPAAPVEGTPATVLVCDTCHGQIEDPTTMDANHWRCLNDSIWSEVPAVQVMAWRLLHRLRSEGWPNELIETCYLDDDTRAWAKADGSGTHPDEAVIHIDSNGNVLEAGDTVVLIQDLKVKGANFTAKRGTAVRRISLVHDNAEQIEGKVDGQHIVLLTKYVKKSK